MWYCLNCDTELDEFQVIRDTDNELSCGFCHGEVEPAVPWSRRLVGPVTAIDPPAVNREVIVVADLGRSDSAVSDEAAMVDEYAELIKAKKEIESQIEKLKSRIINFAEANGKERIDGSTKSLIVNRIDQVLFPDDKSTLINHLRQIGVYDKYSMINYPQLRSAIQRNEVNLSVREFVSVKKDYRLSLRKL